MVMPVGHDETREGAPREGLTVKAEQCNAARGLRKRQRCCFMAGAARRKGPRGRGESGPLPGPAPQRWPGTTKPSAQAER